MVKNPLANTGDVRDVNLIPGLGRPREDETAISPVFLPEKSQGQRSLTSYGPRGRKESDTSEHTCMLFKIFSSSHKVLEIKYICSFMKENK